MKNNVKSNSSLYQLVWVLMLVVMINSVCSIDFPLFTSATMISPQVNSNSIPTGKTLMEKDTNDYSKSEDSSLENCIADVKQSMNKRFINGVSNNVISNNFNKNEESSKTKKNLNTNSLKGKKIFISKDLIEYDLIELAKQTIEICSPDYRELIVSNLEDEIKAGNYSRTCFFSLDLKDENHTNECFEIVLKIEKKVKMHHLLKEKLSSFNTTSQESYKKNNIVPKRLRRKKHKSNSLHIPSPFQFENNKKNGKESEKKKVNISSQEQVRKITKTIHETFVHVSTVPTIFHDFLRKPNLQRPTQSVTITKVKILLSTTTSTVQIKAAVTRKRQNFQSKVSISTKTVGAKKPTTMKTISISNHVKSTSIITQSNEIIVDANYILGDPNTLITTTLVTLSRLPYIARICNALTNFGLACASSSAPSGSDSVITTTTTTKTTTTITSTKTLVTKIITTTTSPTTTTSTRIKTKTKIKSSTSTTLTSTTTTVIKTTKFFHTKTKTDDCEETIIQPPPSFDDCDDEILDPSNRSPGDISEIPNDQYNDEFYFKNEEFLDVLNDENEYYQLLSNGNNKKFRKGYKRPSLGEEAKTENIHMNSFMNQFKNQTKLPNNSNPKFSQYNITSYDINRIEGSAFNTQLSLNVFKEAVILITLIVIIV